MHITTRRKLGVALLVAATLAGVILQLSFGGVVKGHTVRDNRSQFEGGFVAYSEVAPEFNWWYAFPLATIFGAGLVCLLWPQKKPPRLV